MRLFICALGNCICAMRKLYLHTGEKYVNIEFGFPREMSDLCTGKFYLYTKNLHLCVEILYLCTNRRKSCIKS